MRVRRKRIVVLIVATVALCLCICVFHGRSAVNPENVDRITPGMSLSEVEAIMGESATHADVVTGSVLDAQTFAANGGNKYDFRQWTAQGWMDTSCVVVILDNDHVVCRYYNRRPQGQWHRIKARLSSLF